MAQVFLTNHRARLTKTNEVPDYFINNISEANKFQKKELVEVNNTLQETRRAQDINEIFIDSKT